MRLTTAFALAFAAVLVSVAAQPAAAQSLGQKTVPAGTTWEEQYVPASDGIKLHADVLRPKASAPGTRGPVLLIMSPYAAHGGTESNPDPLRDGPSWSTLLNASKPWLRGYTAVYADMRGFGASEGCIDFGGKLDQADARAVADWAARQPWSSGDVVMLGWAYSTIPATAVLADPTSGLRGVVLVGAMPSLYSTQFMNGVPYQGIQQAYSIGFQVPYGVFPGSLADEPAYQAGYLRGLRPDCWAKHHLEQKDPAASTPYWRERNLLSRAHGSRVPVLMGQGFLDAATEPDVLLALWKGLAGDRSAWLGQYSHDQPLNAATVGRDGFVAQFDRFADAVTSGRRIPTGDRGAIVQEAPSGRWRTERHWPPRDRSRLTLQLLAGSYRDLPGNKAETGPLVHPSGSTASPTELLPLTGVGTWTFSPPLAEAHVAGSPVLTVDASGPRAATLIAMLYDVASDGTARLISRGARLLASNGASRLTLYPQDWRIAAGHRIGVLISGADDPWWTPLARTLGEVTVKGGSLRLPVLVRERRAFTEGTAGIRLAEHKPIQVAPATIARRTAR